MTRPYRYDYQLKINRSHDSDMNYKIVQQLWVRSLALREGLG